VVARFGPQSIRGRSGASSYDVHNWRTRLNNWLVILRLYWQSRIIFCKGGSLLNDQNQNGGKQGESGNKRGLLFGIVGALVLGGGGFYAAYSGLIDKQAGGDSQVAQSANQAEPPETKVAFVELPRMIISLGKGATNRHLRFSAQLEVAPKYRAEVETLTPRVLDVLNGYLRAVDARDVETPSALGRLRAQMLRRVQVVTGEGYVRNLLITEFVLN